MKPIKWIQLICLATLLISLLLPWFKNPFFTAYGYSLPTVITMSNNMAVGSFIQKGTDIISFQPYLIYLIPLIILFILVQEIRKRNTDTLHLIAAALSIIILFTIVWGRFNHIFHLMDLGAYLAIATSAILMWATLKQKRMNLVPNKSKHLSWHLLIIFISTILLLLTPYHPFSEQIKNQEFFTSKKRLIGMREALEKYIQDKGYAPQVNSIEELSAKKNKFVGRYLRRVFLRDGWKRPFHYRLGNEPKAYFLISAGENGKFGDKDDLYAYHF